MGPEKQFAVRWKLGAEVGCANEALGVGPVREGGWPPLTS